MEKKPGKKSLRESILRGGMPLKDVIILARGIVLRLGEIHNLGGMYGRLRPENILIEDSVNGCGNSVWLSDDGDEGLAYISPEQSGRLNRLLDYRSDFYSLGAVLYELFTGSKPFDPSSSGGLIHAHIARSPRPLKASDEARVSGFYRIIERLMDKNPEARYQCCRDILMDLTLLDDGGVSVETDDRRARITFPAPIFGREAEAAGIREVLDDVRKGAFGIVALFGEPGIGKTALVRKVLESDHETGGNFVMGKFDSLHPRPYEAFRDAAAVLVRKTLGRGDDEIRRIRERLETSITFGKRIVLSLFPEARYVLDDDGRPAPKPEEARNLTGSLVLRFFSSFIREGEPLILFFDDLQWAEEFSLRLVEQIAGAEIPGLFLVLACRSAEGLKESIEAVDAIVTRFSRTLRINLKPLTSGQTEKLIEQILPFRELDSEVFSELVFARSGGNPLFLRLYLCSLEEEGLLHFDHLEGIWKGDVRKIADAESSSDVVSFLVDRIVLRPEVEKNALTVAACLGNTVQIEILSDILKCPEDATRSILSRAAEDHLLIKNGNETEPTFSFLHDRIRQAAYSLLPDDRKVDLHKQIGYLFIARKAGIFDIVRHLNLALPAINVPEERRSLLELNRQAAIRAKESSDFELTHNCMRTVLALLHDSAWEDAYDNTLGLYNETAEAALLAFDYQDAERYVEIILDKARSTLDAVAATDVRIRSLMARHRMKEAFIIATGTLASLGYLIPERHRRMYARFKTASVGRKLLRIGEKPAALPPMTDLRAKAALKILTTVASSAYIAVPDAFPLVGTLMMDIHLKFGWTNAFPLSLSIFGNVLIDRPRARRTINWLREKIRAFTDTELQEEDLQKILFFGSGMFLGWLSPLADTLEPLTRGFQLAKERGDFEYATLCLQFHNLHTIFCCRNLRDIRGGLMNGMRTAQEVSQTRNIHSTNRLMQFYCNLTAENSDGSVPARGYFDDTIDMGYLRDVGDQCGLGSMCIYKMILAYLLEDYRNVLELAEEAEPFIPSLRGEYLVDLWVFYRALAVAALGGKGAGVLIRSAARRLRLWSRSAPANFLHQYHLLAAEGERLKGQHKEACRLYHLAVSEAEESSFFLDAALARERLSACYREQGRISEAEKALVEARDSFLEYGCLLKVETLEESYPFLRGRQKGLSIDVDTVIEATRIISGEMVLDRLAERLLSIVIENSGATRGVLLLMDTQDLKAAAEGSLEEAIRVRCPPEASRVPETIIRYVRRTGETVTLPNAAEIHPFGRDEYLEQRRLLSVLCIPLVYRSKLLGIVYLENDRIPSAFPAERADLAGTIAAQAAVSLENARLYQSLLEDIEARKTAERELVLSREREKEQQRQILEADKLSSLGVLAAGVAHEVSNPNHIVGLNAAFLEQAGPDILSLLDEAVMGDSSVLLGGLEYEAFRERFLRVVSDIRDCSERIDTIVQELKTYARESGDTPISRVDINAVVTSALRLTAPLTRKATNRFEFVPGEDLPAVRGNAHRLEQVIINLVQNACQALTSADERVLVETARDPSCEGIVVSVTDEGKGIPEDMLRRITDPFFTTRREAGGTGLGLSVSSRIIEEYGGTLSVTSTAGQGTCVRVILPGGETK